MKKRLIILASIIMVLSISTRADVNKKIENEKNTINNLKIVNPTFNSFEESVDFIANKKEEDLLKVFIGKDDKYVNLLNIFKESYVFEDQRTLEPTFSDVESDEDLEHNQEYIDKKLDELIKNQVSAYETIFTEILVQELNKAYNEWKGVRYLWGGDSKYGIDCSALVRRIYRKVFNYELPRVSTSQVTRGFKVSKSKLRPGDILFFRPENRTNHVAVYLGNSLFINASSSKGVVLSSLDNNYWKKYFKYGVRVTGINLRG